MILTPSNVASLSTSLSRWEIAEYVFAGLVTLACAGEYIADFTTLITGGCEERRKRLAKISTLLLIVSLSLELICLAKTNSLSGMLIGSLSERAEEADEKARRAITDSSTALSQAKDALDKAGAAQGSIGKAEDEANKAQASASNASTLARGARQEADSFERDIVAAKKQATDAESHLAEALRRAAEATAELNRLKSPRQLSRDQVNTLVANLSPYASTAFSIIIETNDFDRGSEQMVFGQQLTSILEAAKWKHLSNGEDMLLPYYRPISQRGVTIASSPNLLSTASVLSNELNRFLISNTIRTFDESGVTRKNFKGDLIVLIVGIQ
ncbi:MAG: hypothetical protein WBD19_09570 [Candidatus Acidiferrum sp.]